MEHAVEALKLATAVIVFVLAVTLTYMLFSKTKSTADSIFYIRDSQKYLEEENLENIIYLTSSAVNTNREVQMETIIPTLYRYHKENFGVTIVVKEGGGYKILARYDNTTENIVGTWDGTYDPDSAYLQVDGTYLNEEGEDVRPTINRHLEYLNEYVVLKNAATGDPIFEWTASDLSSIYTVERRIDPSLGESSPTEPKIATPWLNSETGISSRISSDVSGIPIIYNNMDVYHGVVGNSLGTIDPLNNLLKYSDQKFTEIIKIIDNNIYVSEVGAGGAQIPTEFVQEKLISKSEIIYIMQ